MNLVGHGRFWGASQKISLFVEYVSLDSSSFSHLMKLRYFIYLFIFLNEVDKEYIDFEYVFDDHE